MHLEVQVLTDSETLFQVIIRYASTTKRRLMVDVKAAKEAYYDEIINAIVWIRRKFNLVDGMTKADILPELIITLKRTRYIMK